MANATPKLHNPYTRVSQPVPELAACPLCGCAGEAWRYQQEPDTLPTVVIMCSKLEAFAVDECGCLLSVPPSCFFLSTVREAADYWNSYAAWVLAQRGPEIQPKDVRKAIERLKRIHTALLTGFTAPDGSLVTNVNQRFGYAQASIADVIDALELLVQP